VHHSRLDDADHDAGVDVEDSFLVGGLAEVDEADGDGDYLNSETVRN